MGNCQIIRIASYTKGAINHIGREEYRTVESKNTNIDKERKKLNITIGNKDATLYQLWKERLEKLNLKFKGQKNQIAMEQAIITASPEFFKRLGWDKEQARTWTKADIPKEIIKYFNDSLKFMNDYLGRKNLLSATVHFDEETPHLHVDYIPAIDGKHKRRDVYLKDENGHCIKNEKGRAIRAKGPDGKTLYEYIDEQASINRSLFWNERGGRHSYRKLQDLFYEQVGRKYDLGRGEIGSDRVHEEQSKHKARKLKEKIVEGNNIIKQQAAHIDRQYTTIETNNKKIAKQNKTIDSINEAIKEVEKDKAVMKKLEQELGLRKTAERGFQR